MKVNILNKATVCVLAMAFIMCACSTKRRTAKQNNNSEMATTNDNSIKTFEMNSLAFQTMSGRAKSKVTINNKTHSFTSNIRIEYDHKIWISATALLGIEAARIMITPDSIKIMNKLNSEYIEKPFSYLSQYTNPSITFKSLQDILIGNMTTAFLRSGEINIASSDNQLFVLGSKDDLDFQYGINQQNRPFALKLTDNTAKQTLEAGYKQYFTSDGYIFPQSISIKISGAGEPLNIDLDYNQVQFDKNLEYPFTIPARFKTVK